MDTFGVNYYAGWYEYSGRPDTIPYTLSARLEQWYSATKKPFFMSEYGAAALSGLHKVSLPVTDMLSGSYYMYYTIYMYMCAHLATCTILLLSKGKCQHGSCGVSSITMSIDM